jgi:(p)ppGpp synthase/HD superfamily hydrolase
MTPPWSPDAWIDAARFAAEAHRSQRVPGTELPYLLHVTTVAQEVAGAIAIEGGDGDLAIRCALLHDTIEDCGVSRGAIAARFGEAVASGVAALSKVDGPTKEARMLDSLRRIAEQPEEIWMVKLADRITNLQPPPGHWTAQKCAAYHAEAGLILDRLGAASPWLSGRLQAKRAAYLPFTVAP